MSTFSNTVAASAVLSVQRIVTDACVRYEEAWRAGARPEIESHLGGLGPAARRALLRELIALDFELRYGQGERPTPSEYLDRFPDDAPTVLFALSGAGADGPTGSGSGGTEHLLTSTEGAGGAAPGASPAGLAARQQERYSLIEEHARGGVGEVWRACDHELGREVALKRLQADKVDNPAIRARFLREARITGQLQHPGVVPVFGCSPDAGDGRPYYTMRFVKGRTLSESARDYHRHRQAGAASRVELQELLTAFVHVCQVVAYAHSRGVIHRDLKGANVLLGDFGEVMVVDWGMARVVGTAGPDDGGGRRGARPRGRTSGRPPGT